MRTGLQHLTPAEAWEEAQGRSIAIGFAGWLVVACLHAAGAIPAIYRPSLIPASALAAVFLTALALYLVDYHNCWRVGVCTTVVTLFLPFTLNLLWVRFSGLSLIYPLAAVSVIGVVCLHFIHRRLSGPSFGDDVESAIIEEMMADFRPTWIDRATALFFLVGFVLFLILLLR